VAAQCKILDTIATTIIDQQGVSRLGVTCVFSDEANWKTSVVHPDIEFIRLKPHVKMQEAEPNYVLGYN
jgi:hypothetical protein